MCKKRGEQKMPRKKLNKNAKKVTTTTTTTMKPTWQNGYNHLTKNSFNRMKKNSKPERMKSKPNNTNENCSCKVKNWETNARVCLAIARDGIDVNTASIKSVFKWIHFFLLIFHLSVVVALAPSHFNSCILQSLDSVFSSFHVFANKCESFSAAACACVRK